jgi:hypothetical protein
MARGWESKGVEEQIDARERRSDPSTQPVNAEQLAIQRARESLELSRTRVLQDLAAARNENYRIILQRSLAYLDVKIAELSRNLEDTPK